MKHSFRRILFAVVSLVAVLANSATFTLACGPYMTYAKFSLTKHADLPLGEFATGRTGIVPHSFGVMSLALFYRQLNGVPLSAAERDGAVRAMETQIYYLSDSTSTPKDQAGDPDYVANWLKARAKVDPAKKEAPSNDLLGERYEWTANCLPDAYRTATRTLEARIAEHGTGADVGEWLQGQDTVFANCGGGAKLPSELSDGAPEWLRKDRAYQIAAARFYAGLNPESRADFDRIAADAASPWRATARFVAARTLIREAGKLPVAEDSSEVPAEALKLYAEASERLEKIATDTSMTDFRASARRLIGLVKYRSASKSRRAELGAILAGASREGAEDVNFYNYLTDYMWLLDPIFASAESAGEKIEIAEAVKAGRTWDYNYVLKLRDVPAESRDDELTDWIMTFKAADGLDHAVERWNATKRLPWLVAAISKADAKSAASTMGLTGAAESVERTSPAFATVRHHLVRLALERGDKDAARKMLDDVLAKRELLPVSTLNRFLAQRLSVAKSFNEFLEFAPRRAAIIDSDESGSREVNEIYDNELTPWLKREMFDADSAAFLNEKVPLSLLRRAALDERLAPELRRFLVLAVWTRAFVLRDNAVEREFAPLVRRQAPEFSTYFTPLATASGNAEREAAALLAVMRYPVIQPYVPVGLGREGDDPTSIFSYRGNWWCVKQADDDSKRYDIYNFEYPASYPEFLSAAEKAAAEREMAEMKKGGNSSTYLARRALEFADRFPNHPKTPELLHLAVRTTRYGCSDADTGRFSKQAFERLHKRYPNSPWTEKTPYWFS